MTATVADELVRVVDQASRQFRELDPELAARKKDATGWSIKEVLGHLVDSAANNHQRFVRGQQVAELTLPGYDQDAWVAAQHYQSYSWPALVDFWVAYNHLLAHVIRRIPQPALSVTCRIGSNEPVTLGFIVEDYLSHLRHHLEQIEGLR